MPPLKSVTITAENPDIHIKAYNEDSRVTIIGVPGSYSEKYAQALRLSHIWKYLVGLCLLSVYNTPFVSSIPYYLTNGVLFNVAGVFICYWVISNGKIIGSAENEIRSLASGRKTVMEFYGYDSATVDHFQYYVNQAHTF